MKFKLETLSNDEIIKIHESSLAILSKVGVKIDSDKVLDFLSSFKEVEIDIRKKIVKFSPSLVNDIIQKVPSSFKLFSLNKNNSLIIGKNNNHASNGHCAGYIFDSGKKMRRRALTKDVKNFSILCDYIDNFDITTIECIPEDIANEKMSLIEGAQITLTYSNKPFQFLAEKIYEDKAIKNILKIVTKSTDLSKNPSVLMGGLIFSPLWFSKENVEILLENSIIGVPVSISCSPVTGISAPMSLPGYIALYNAEILCGVVINQLVKPGNPIIYGCACASFNMKEGVTNIATPETTLFRASIAQMAKFYKIPSSTSGLDTDSNCFDQQNGWEKFITSYISFASGINLVGNAGSFSTATTVSYEQLIIDSEIIGYIKRFADNIKIDSESLTLDTISNVGPSGNFLSQDHTINYFNNYGYKEYYDNSISNRNMFDKWKNNGSKKIDATALEKAKEIIRIYRPQYLEKHQIKEINKYMKSVEQEISSV